MSTAFAALQRALPQHAMTRAIGRLARSRNGFIKTTFIRGFARAYRISLSEAQVQSLDAFESFNAFFTRALQSAARPIDPDPHHIVSPADGAISQCGSIERGTVLQAKGTHYNLEALAGGPLAGRYEGGRFVTVYLAPHNYHRVHMPLAGTLVASRSIPGALFSVNARTEAAISDLFCRNERLVCEFDTAAGPMLVVLVGALIVGSIDSVFGSPPSPYLQVTYSTHAVALDKGAELGRFLLGSTVVVCLANRDAAWLDGLGPGSPVQMGAAIGSINTRKTPSPD